MGAHDLEVLGADGGTVLSVSGYDGDGASASGAPWTAPSGIDATTLSEAAQVLQCMLPVQTALGTIPSFFENRSEQRVGGGIVGSAADAPPLLPSWDGARTLLGAYFTAAVCVHATATEMSWECACPSGGRPSSLLGDLGDLCAPSKTLTPSAPWAHLPR
jgi:hypothetical protein